MNEEQALARRVQHDNDLAAAQLLVLHNLRFVLKIANQYQRSGCDPMDLFQEGTIGLMQAVRRFDPDRGYRLISYAVFWIRAYICMYVLRHWSLVKMGGGRIRRHLFFALRTEQAKAESELGKSPESREVLANRLGVSEANITDMEIRLAARDLSLDESIDIGWETTYGSLLASSDANPEERLASAELCALVSEQLDEARGSLTAQERDILENRILAEEPLTLKQLGKTHGVSRERIRQIEKELIEKLRRRLQLGGAFQELDPAPISRRQRRRRRRRLSSYRERSARPAANAPSGNGCHPLGNIPSSQDDRASTRAAA